MNVEILNEMKQGIFLAFEEKNKSKIEKETIAVINHLIISMMCHFPERLRGITYDVEGIQFDDDFLTSEDNRDALLHFLYVIDRMEIFNDILNFGKLKVELEDWFYELGGQVITFDYHESYLLKPKEVAEILGVSTVTLNKYVKNGFEYIPRRSQNRIPKHMIELWKDTMYSIKVQVLYKDKKNKLKEPEEQYNDLLKEIAEFQIKYKAETVKAALTLIDRDNINFQDYYEWECLEKELNEIKNELFSMKEDKE